MPVNSFMTFLSSSSWIFLWRCINATYSLFDFRRMLTMRVAFASAIGKTPVTLGSSVPL